MSASLLAFVYVQLILIPILGLIWLGIRRERIERDRQMNELLKTLRIVGVSRGRHIR